MKILSNNTGLAETPGEPTGVNGDSSKCSWIKTTLALKMTALLVSLPSISLIHNKISTNDQRIDSFIIRITPKFIQ